MHGLDSLPDGPRSHGPPAFITSLGFYTGGSPPPPVPAPLRVLYLGYLTLTSPLLVSTIDIHINHSLPQKHTPPHAPQNQDPSSLAHPDACKPYHLRRGQGTHHRKVQLCEPEIPFDKGR
ncbi:hypothetical protein FPCIR_12195 [Fusarium pseudocircinatum]|uniref:Uncharacterized protein n=1 Tax=Fusarium pseudocircinatum TaxID=56676 RepID=A0A8H5KSS4_9HYPO|nr:hypothetical protein FPCIR_12195 [Fusarium pseudocircinatum]